MRKKWWNIINGIILIAIIIFLVFFVFRNSLKIDATPLSEDCVDVNHLASLSYDSCYDAYSKSIYLKAKRGYDRYRILAFEFSFFDFSQQFYRLSDVPNVGDFKAYKIPSGKNPGSIDISLDIFKDFSESVCKEPRSIPIDYCSSNGVSLSLSPLGDVELGDFIDINDSYSRSSDSVDISLADREKIWELKCASVWKCSNWDSCDDGFQKRICTDVNNCFVSTNPMITVKYCDDRCQENWQCEWSACTDGFSVPDCVDLSGCNTKYDLPQKLDCRGMNSCVPDVICSEWSNCEVNYNFDGLNDGVYKLNGVKSRICEDENRCVISRQETRDCSVSVDIYTERFSKCGKDFVAVYDRLSKGLVARIEENKGDNPYLNINFDDRGVGEYCDYCFDGVLDGDEEMVDCGGSCEKCSEKYKDSTYENKFWLDRFSDWIFRT